MLLNSLLEKNLLPDALIRFGIRRLLKQRLTDETKGDTEAQQEHLNQLIEFLKKSPIAVETDAANTQHYEVPTQFYQFCLGPHLKYSSAYWNNGVNSLGEAEKDMLELTCSRAGLQNGQEVLELGCGWGSLSLFMATKYPGSSFTVVSNSRTQKIYIDEEARKRGLPNLRVLTVNINQFELPGQFDRVVSVEMFEHMRNYRELMKLVSNHLKPEGKLFVHIFTHKEYAYLFEEKDSSDWMSRYFFTGGIMPSDNLLFYFNEHLCVENHWHVNGTHYQKTAEAWLKNMSSHKTNIMLLFEQCYGPAQALKWWVYWRVFFMACAELWGYRQGNEWMVSHYLFYKKP